MAIQNIVIQSKTGLPLFARSLTCPIGVKCIDISTDKTFDEDTILNSALISAMLVYNDATPEDFHDLQLEKTSMLSFPTQDIITLFAVDPNIDSGKYKNRLKVTSELFERNYKELIEKLHSITDFSCFNGFEGILVDNGIFDEGEKFQSNCFNCEWSKKCVYRVTTGPVNNSVIERFNSIKSLSLMKKFKLMMKAMIGKKNL